MAGVRPVRLTVYTDAVARGGAEQSLHNLLSHLGPHIDASVLGVDRELGEWLGAARPGTTVHTVALPRGKFNVGSILEHIHAVRRLRPDILHANLHTTFACQYGILAGLLAPGVRVVAVEQSPIGSGSRVQRLTKRFASRRLAAHVSVGRRSARMVEEVVGLAPGTVLTIYNGVPGENASARERRERAPVVGSLGRLSHEKGFDVLIRALPHVDASLVLVGDGPRRAELEALAEELGVRERLEITGWTNEARSYLSTFDVFCLPSRFEGFPLTIPEALLERLPVVASDVGSVSEAVLETTGLLVPPDDPAALAAALQTLLDDPGLRRRLGERGRILAQERFTAPTMARAFEELYDDLLAPSAARRRQRQSGWAK
jgi:glycosyltransferase involved in cell wall biosynthesis